MHSPQQVLRRDCPFPWLLHNSGQEPRVAIRKHSKMTKPSRHVRLSRRTVLAGRAANPATLIGSPAWLSTPGIARQPSMRAAQSPAKQGQPSLSFLVAVQGRVRGCKVSSGTYHNGSCRVEPDGLSCSFQSERGIEGNDAHHAPALPRV